MSRCKLCSEGSQVPDLSHIGCVLPTSDLNQYLYLGYSSMLCLKTVWIFQPPIQ